MMGDECKCQKDDKANDKKGDKERKEPLRKKFSKWFLAASAAALFAGTSCTLAVEERVPPIPRGDKQDADQLQDGGQDADSDHDVTDGGDRDLGDNAGDSAVHADHDVMDGGDRDLGDTAGDSAAGDGDLNADADLSDGYVSGDTSAGDAHLGDSSPGDSVVEECNVFEDTFLGSVNINESTSVGGYEITYKEQVSEATDDIIVDIKCQATGAAIATDLLCLRTAVTEVPTPQGMTIYIDNRGSNPFLASLYISVVATP